MARFEPHGCGIPLPLPDGLLVYRLPFAFRLALDGSPRIFSSLLIGQHGLILELVRALQGRRGHVVPDPLQIRIAPRRVWLLPFCSRGLGRTDLSYRWDRHEQHDTERREQRSERSATHVNLRLLI